MSTKNNSCNICYDTDMDYCITSEELNSAIASALSQLRSELEGLENQTYTKIEIDQMIQDLTMGNVDLSNYYTIPQVDGKFEWVYNRLNEIEGKTINIDEDLSSTSTNPVQNKIVTENIVSLGRDLQELQRQVGEIDTILNSVLYSL